MTDAHGVARVMPVSTSPASDAVSSEKTELTGLFRRRPHRAVTDNVVIVARARPLGSGTADNDPPIPPMLAKRLLPGTLSLEEPKAAKSRRRVELSPAVFRRC